jgi:hypothetical protein
MVQLPAPLRIILTVAVAAFWPLALAAQESAGVEAADEVSEVASPSMESWTPTRAVSDWDLYAGRVYATTSPVWVQAEYLLWWLQGNPLPPLLTTSTPGTPRAEAGVLGEPNTQVLLGGDRVDDQARSGFRTSLGIRLGHWFDALMDAEVQFDYLWLGDGQTSGGVQTDSFEHEILARPFFNTQTGQQDAQLISFPNVIVGGVLMETSSDLRSAGVLFRREWRSGSRGRLEWVAGYRYFQLQERWGAQETLLVTDPGGDVAMGTTFDMLEGISTWNEFHGGDLGLQWWLRTGGCTFEIVTKMAIGGIARTVELGGETLITSPGDAPLLTPGGLLVQPTNMGRYRTGRFTALPELSIKVRRQLTRQLVLTAGYSLMVVDHVVRSGDQLDLAVNPTQFGGGTLAGAARPAVLMHDSTLWLHGLSVGLEW